MIAAGAATAPDNPFLTEERLTLIGMLNAELLLGDMSWLHRRRETVTLIDDTTLHRTVSVDYTLPASFPHGGWPPDWPQFPRHDRTTDALEGVPFMVLPKLPANLSNFDLKNESGRSLPVLTRQDDTLISAHTLEAMARMHEADLPDGIVTQLHAIAQAKSDEVDVHLERFVYPLPEDGYPGIREDLFTDPQVGWWIRTLAKSSIVMAFLPADTDRRRILKMSYDEPIDPPRGFRMLLVQLGMTSWDFWVQNPFIAATNYHLEYVCPEGMRARKSVLLDVTKNDTVTAKRFIPHVHLYSRNAQDSRDVLAWVSLRPDWRGLLGLSAAIAVWMAGSIFVIWLSPGKVADAPSGVPALLLLVTGVVGPLVTRTDPHVVTSRVLSRVRVILLLSAFAAYVAALLIALSPRVVRDDPQTRHDAVHYIHEALRWPVIVAGTCAVALFIALALNLPFVHQLWSAIRKRLTTFATGVRNIIAESSYEAEAIVHMTPAAALERMKTETGFDPVQDLEAGGTLLVVRHRRLGPLRLWTRALFARAEEADEGARLISGVRYTAPFFMRPSVGILLLRARAGLRRVLEGLVSE
jgi:hypothetical protein